MEKDLSLVYDLQTFLLVRGRSLLFPKSIKVTTDQNCQVSYCKMLKKNTTKEVLVSLRNRMAERRGWQNACV